MAEPRSKIISKSVRHVVNNSFEQGRSSLHAHFCENVDERQRLFGDATRQVSASYHCMNISSSTATSFNNIGPYQFNRVWCSGNIVDSHFSGVTALSTAPGSTPGIRVSIFFGTFFCLFTFHHPPSFASLSLLFSFLFLLALPVCVYHCSLVSVDTRDVQPLNSVGFFGAFLPP
ncbi:uncharacterized protein B0T23DRAFT_200238 [Neurospora hispaniola]|uniref:Uncharacterized protein n=1 Tax=Neurospora hispaniola TaxID=588809 RepID=A0AAJ0I4J4_9PEZI|nr:hypothetical protein B0T23DRAFT_200238 [Neurospora hispaniola]